MQYYLGIDIGKYVHEAILCDENGKPLEGSLRFKATYEGYQQLVAYVERTAGVHQFEAIHAGMEATGSYWLSLYQQLRKLRIRVSVLNPLQVKAYRNEGIRGAKNDRIDALLIVKVLKFGDYKESDLPKEDILALRQLTRLRSDLVSMTSSLKLKVIAIFDQVFPEYKTLFYDMFATTSSALLQEAVLPEEIAAISTKKLTILLDRASRGRQGEKEAKHIKKVAKQSIGVTLALDAFAMSLKILLTQISHLEEQIQKLDVEIMQRVTIQQTTLTTIPGIGITTAGTIIAEVGSFERFAKDKDGAEKLVALAGIDPKIKQSGILKGRTKMSKRGSPYLRQAVRQAAFVAACGLRKDPMFAAIYDKQVKLGKHFEVALSHVENKMLHVIYSLLKSKKEYIPNI
jgi:transposase